MTSGDTPPGYYEAVATALTGEDEEYVSEPFRFTLEPSVSYHKADYNGNEKFELAELLRLIQFYNAEAYHCDSGAEDGYAPGNGSRDCAPHSSDYSPQDWRIGLNELLRLIQLYNAQGGYVRTSETEDGFAPPEESP